MSKARGNVINPDVVVAEYGADSLRLYEMFMGPLEAVKPWSMKGVEGVYRFLARAWRMIVDAEADVVRLDERVVPQRDDARAGESRGADRRVGHRRLRSAAVQYGDQPADGVRQFLHVAGDASADRRWRRSRCLLSPMAPHIAEELWHVLGKTKTLAYEPWPEFDPALLVEEQVEIPVQVNGKLRGRVVVAADADAAAIEQVAREDSRIAVLLDGKTVRKVVVVPGKLVNFVVG